MQKSTAVPHQHQTHAQSERMRLVPADLEGTAVFGFDEVDRALAELSMLTAMTPFQTPTWLTHAYQHLAASKAHQPCCAILRSRRLDKAVLALPLVIARDRGLVTAGFADYGIADYGAPMLADDVDWSLSRQHARELCNTLANTLNGVARISLTNMPLKIGDRPNPLANIPGAFPSAHSRYVVNVADDVASFLAGRGKKYRKEAERCYRLLDDTGPWTFQRAQSQHEIDQMFANLQRLQAQKWQGHEADYHLEAPEISAAYRANLGTGSAPDGAQIFQMTCAETPVAVLYGVHSEGMFTLLRIASAQGAWRRISPGRLIVLETMRHFHRRGVHTFDLGIGAYAFKEGLGARAEALVDLELARTIAARPRVMLMQAKGWTRRYPRVRAGVQRVRTWATSYRAA